MDPAKRPLLYGHRGASAHLPENTMAAFRLALEQGAEAIESDVHLTRDGHVVMAHDDDGERMAGVARNIRECSLDEVQRWDVGYGVLDDSGHRPHAGQGHRIPTLLEAIEAFPGVRLNLDVKQKAPSMVDALVECIHGAGAADRVLLASFDSAILSEVRRAGYQGPVGLGRGDMVKLVFTPGAALRALGWPRWREPRAQLPTHSGRIRFDTPSFIAKAHSLGIRVDFWTINEPELADRLLTAGADGLVSDCPGELVDVVDRHARRRGA